jgi:hypothetical protein
MDESLVEERSKLKAIGRGEGRLYKLGRRSNWQRYLSFHGALAQTQSQEPNERQSE